MRVPGRFPYYVKWNNPEIGIFMKKPSIRTRWTLFLHSKITRLRLFSTLLNNLSPSLLFSLPIYLFSFRFLLPFLTCSYSILPPYHHLLLHLSFLQYVPTLSSVLLIFPFFSFSFKLLSRRFVPSWSWNINGTHGRSEGLQIYKLIRNELSF